MEERVTLVESLEKKRQPFTEMEVVYIVAPTSESVQRICADFDAAQCMYGDVHIFILSPIPDELMGVLGKAPLLVQRLKTLKELNLHFLASKACVLHGLKRDKNRCLPRSFDSDLAMSVVALAPSLVKRDAERHSRPAPRERAVDRPRPDRRLEPRLPQAREDDARVSNRLVFAT
jgi:hypothetical protein